MRLLRAEPSQSQWECQRLRLGCGNLEAESGLVLLRRRFDLALVQAELGMGARFGALRAVVPHGHGGGERCGRM